MSDASGVRLCNDAEDRVWIVWYCLIIGHNCAISCRVARLKGHDLRVDWRGFQHRYFVLRIFLGPRQVEVQFSVNRSTDGDGHTCCNKWTKWARGDGVAQLIDRWTQDSRTRGSNPVRSTQFLLLCWLAVGGVCPINPCVYYYTARIQVITLRFEHAPSPWRGGLKLLSHLLSFMTCAVSHWADSNTPNPQGESLGGGLLPLDEMKMRSCVPQACAC